VAALPRPAGVACWTSVSVTLQTLGQFKRVGSTTILTRWLLRQACRRNCILEEQTRSPTNVSKRFQHCTQDDEPDENIRQVETAVRFIWRFLLMPLLFCLIGTSINFSTLSGSTIQKACSIVFAGEQPAPVPHYFMLSAPCCDTLPAAPPVMGGTLAGWAHVAPCCLEGHAPVRLRLLLLLLPPGGGRDQPSSKPLNTSLRDSWQVWACAWS